MKLFIIGSCVSRDALAFAGEPSDIELTGYYARSSLAVLPSGPVALPPELSRQPSNWRRRMVEADHCKNLLRSVRAAQFDILLLDLIDERFRLLETAGHRVVTYSADYAAVAPKPLPGRLISSGSEQHVAWWRQGLSLLLAALEEQGRTGALRVNRVFWAKETEDGQPITGQDLLAIDAANAFLAARYKDIAGLVGENVFIDYPPTLLRADPHHKWGLSPFHYVRAFYVEQIARLRALGKPAAPPWRIELHALPNRWTVRLSGANLSPGEEAAFYLMRGKERVTMKWYGPQVEATFERQTTPGCYHALGFVRAGSAAKPLIIRSADITIQPKPGYDVAAWKLPVFNHESGEGWPDRAALEDGIHRFALPGGHTLDLLLRGLVRHPASTELLVSFGGAIANRSQLSAPFFCGQDTAEKLQRPIVCVSDPVVSFSPALTLAWYAGYAGCDDLPQRIASLLDDLASLLNMRLVIFGSSGGGFAAINVLGRLRNSACAVVWNPQTSIGKYHANAVRDYLDSAFGMESGSVGSLESRLQSSGTAHNLVADFPRRAHPLLFLQSLSDIFHVEQHARPFLRSESARRIAAGVFGGERGTCLCVGKWGQGHSPLPSVILLHVLKQMLSDDDVQAVGLGLSLKFQKEFGDVEDFVL